MFELALGSQDSGFGVLMGPAVRVPVFIDLDLIMNFAVGIFFDECFRGGSGTENRTPQKHQNENHRSGGCHEPVPEFIVGCSHFGLWNLGLYRPP